MGFTKPKEGRPFPRRTHRSPTYAHDFIGRAAGTSNRDCAQVDFGIELARAGRQRRARGTSATGKVGQHGWSTAAFPLIRRAAEAWHASYSSRTTISFIATSATPSWPPVIKPLA